MSWKSPKTLAATLETYRAQNLFSHFDDVCILFQEISPQDKEIAEKFGVRFIGTEKNIGIYGGMKLLAEAVQTDYILMLENDCILIENEDQIRHQLQLAKRRLVNNQAKVYRLRSRWQPGEKFDTLDKYRTYHLKKGEEFNFHKFLLRYLRPTKYQKLIGTAVYEHDTPTGYLYDKFISQKPEGDFIIDSAVLPWTNQSVMVERKWFLNETLPYVQAHPSRRTVAGFQDVEKSLNGSWWRKNHFKIGVGRGLFSHERLDR